MHGYSHIDPKIVADQRVTDEFFAVVYAPGKRRKKRFPENCVSVFETQAQAMDAADADKNLHPGIVIGPSRSSEGLRLYYLVRWL
ncbi:MAG: hypothetical protein ACPG4N_02270 [Gammaproteobacteria bacterium]